MKAIIQHLRFPFSLLLMPVFIFSLYFVSASELHFEKTLLLFVILHVLIYPASNAYNSTQDRDEGSVGLIKDPLPVPPLLKKVSLGLDLLAAALSLLLHPLAALLIAVYIIFSRLYSWRKVRLKRFPMLGFLTVFFCQGGLIFFIVQIACRTHFDVLPYQSFFKAFTASLFIGSMYPLSQIYQHEQDKRDGVITISAVLGYRNTFLFSGLQFFLASILIAYLFMSAGNWQHVAIYASMQLPVIIFFLYWFYQVMKNVSEANYKNTMLMNLISACCMNSCFAILLFIR
jgi:1,4-dihydroxy-2-naphthoate octaprenyltransferase